MRSMSIGTEPIAVTSLYPTAAPAAADVSDSSFAQSLQDTIDLGGAQTVKPETRILAGESQQPDDVIVQESVQPMEDAAPQQETLESEPSEEGIVIELVTNRDDTVQYYDAIQHFGSSQETEELDETAQPSLLPDIDLIDPELLEELTDLLAKTEEMLATPQKMQDALRAMIRQAFERLSDPEIKEEEFTEKVLEFLLKFIDKAFGGDTEESSSLTDTDHKDDTDVMDVLLQAVVQMLDNIRSENADDGVPEDAAEEVEGVEHIPDTNMAKEYVSTSVNQLLGEDEKQAIELDATAETATTADAVPAAETAAAQQNSDYIPQPEQTEHLQAETVSAGEAIPAIPESAAAQTTTEKITVDNTAATEIKAEDTPKDMPAAETVQPKETAEDSTLDQAAEQTAATIFAAIMQTQRPAAAEEPELKETGIITEGIGTKVIPEPKDELAELARMVKVREHIGVSEVRPDPRRAVISPVKPVLEPESAGAAIPFEAAIAKSVPQISLSHIFADSESGAEQIVTQIVSEIFNQLPESGGTTTFVMTLNPESLGKVTVKLVEEAGKISVSVTAHEKRTAEILSQRFDSLQTAMKENGTQLEKYQVVYAPEKDERSGQQNFDGSSKNPYVKQDNEEGEGDGEFAELLQNAV